MLTGAAIAQTGDTCGDAIPITTSLGTTSLGAVILAGATASGQGNCGSAAWRDRWYTFTVPSPPGARFAQVSVSHLATSQISYNWSIEFFRTSTCSSLMGNPGGCFTGTNFETLATNVGVALGEQYYLRFAVDGPSSPNFGGTLQITYECSESQSLLLPGTFTFNPPVSPLVTPFSCGVGFDTARWFTYVVNCDGVIELDTCGSDFETIIEVHGAMGVPCGTPVACSTGDCGPNGRVVVPVTAGETLIFRIGGRLGASGTGRLRLAEPARFANFVCSLAQTLPEGDHEFVAGCLYSNLLSGFPAPTCGVVNSNFPSAWYRYEASAAGGLSIDACASDLPVTLQVWSACPGTTGAVSVHCSDQGCGALGESGQAFVTTVVQGQVLYVRLYVRQAAQPANPLVGTLRLTIDQTGQLGDFVCPGQPNSAGPGAVLALSGSASVSANDLLLEVNALPNQSLGFFVTSQSAFTVPNPGGSQGNLCIASLSMGRYASQVLNSGATGQVMMPVDLASLPLGNFGIAAVPGETWYWQYWYRDMNPGVTSNFSSARCLTLQ